MQIKRCLLALYLSSLLLLSGCASQPMDTMVTGPERELLLQQQALFSGSDKPPEEVKYRPSTTAPMLESVISGNAAPRAASCSQ